MAAVQVYQYFVLDTDERTVQGGSLSKARTIALSDRELTDQTFKIAASGIVKVWDAAENESMSDFDFLWIESDFDVLVQFTASAGVNDVYVTEEIQGSGVAGEMGAARILNSDRMDLLDGTIDSLDGTADTIDEIWVRNPSTTDVARVRLVVAT